MIAGDDGDDSPQKDSPESPNNNGDIASQTATVYEELTPVYETLSAITIVDDGEITYTPSEYEDFDARALFNQLESAKEALDETTPTGETPSKELEAAQGSIILTEIRLTIYGRLHDIANSESKFISLAESEQFGDAASTLEDSLNWANETNQASQAAIEAVTRFEANDLPTPDLYSLSAIESEAKAFSEPISITTPITALQGWASGLQNGITASLLADQERFEAAYGGYQAAISHLEVAQENFSRIKTTPPVFDTTVSRWDCGIQQLKGGYETAAEAMAEAQNGNGDRASELSEEANQTISEYRGQCFES
jgi:hypothetical protein